MVDIRDLTSDPLTLSPDRLGVISQLGTGEAYKTPISNLAPASISAFSAYKADNYIVTTTPTEVKADTEIYDSSGEYSIGGGVFIPNYAGLYLVNVRYVSYFTEKDVYTLTVVVDITDGEPSQLISNYQTDDAAIQFKRAYCQISALVYMSSGAEMLSPKISGTCTGPLLGGPENNQISAVRLA